jgi:hypothetical protein
MGIFGICLAWIVTQIWAIPHLVLARRSSAARRGRGGPAGRPGGYDTMRVRPPSAYPTIGAEPTRAADPNRMDLAA